MVLLWFYYDWNGWAWLPTGQSLCFVVRSKSWLRDGCLWLMMVTSAGWFTTAFNGQWWPWFVVAWKHSYIYGHEGSYDGRWWLFMFKMVYHLYCQGSWWRSIKIIKERTGCAEARTLKTPRITQLPLPAGLLITKQHLYGCSSPPACFLV